MSPKKLIKDKEQTPLTLNYSVPITENASINGDFLIRGIAINATITSNNHQFLSEELQKSSSTLIGVPLLTDHENRVENIKGRVINSDFDEVNQRITFKANVKDTKIQSMIREGLINSVSVGAAVENIEEGDNGVLIPRGIVFKELSLVAVPADHDATFTMALKEAYETIKPLKELEEKEDVIEVRETSQSNKFNDEMKGGFMEEKIVAKEEHVDMTETLNLLKQIQEEMKALKEQSVARDKALEEAQNKAKALEERAKADAEARAKLQEAEMVEEKLPYKVVQGFGSLRGSSFTYVK